MHDIFSKSQPLKIAAVLPRYGASLGGGAETLVREIFLNLNSDPDIRSRLSLQILTTCAVDHRTWENSLPPGECLEDGLSVIRFPVDERNLEIFIRAEQKLHQGFTLSSSEQISWLEQSVNSKALYNYLLVEGRNFDLVFFAPYLFGTSFWGPLLMPEKSVLIPCLHDEAYAYQPIFRNLFRKVKGIMWNAEPEATLAERIYNIPDMNEKGRVVGMGFEKLPSIVETGNSIHSRPYLLYSGRKETGKNLHYLIQCYEEYRAGSSKPFDLLLIGSGKIDFLDELPEGVVDKGFVSEEDKRLFLSQAKLFIQPSTNESFSIVLMEAWREGTPVLVHSDCAVTSHHVKKSDGGYYFRSAREFIDVISEIEHGDTEAQEKGQNGMKFVEEEYSWDAVRKRFFEGLKIWSDQAQSSGAEC